MKQITNKEYEEWQKYKAEKAKGHIPVSYTHLDVYKRQLSPSGRAQSTGRGTHPDSQTPGRGPAAPGQWPRPVRPGSPGNHSYLFNIKLSTIEIDAELQYQVMDWTEVGNGELDFGDGGGDVRK